MATGKISGPTQSETEADERRLVLIGGLARYSNLGELVLQGKTQEICDMLGFPVTQDDVNILKTITPDEVESYRTEINRNFEEVLPHGV